MVLNSHSNNLLLEKWKDDFKDEFLFFLNLDSKTCFDKFNNCTLLKSQNHK